MILDIVWMLFKLDTQQNLFPQNLGTFKINCFLCKLPESYGIEMSEPSSNTRTFLYRG
jgi:hypothetical protein